MKNRFVKFSAIFMVGAIAVGGGSRAVAYASPLQAGISAALTDCLNNSENALDTEEESEPERTEPEEKTICGYKNLGIAVVDNYLNVRETADENGKIKGKMPAKAGCEILGEENGWYQIRSGKVTGYVKSDFIATGKKAAALAEKYQTTVATVNTQTVYIREEPNTECTILTIVTTGEELEAVEEKDGWVEVKLDDENGFVCADYVDISQELKKAMTITEATYGEGVSDVRLSLVQKALSYVGNPYVWGGTSLTNGADCSGFTMRILAMYGVYLPHSSRAQAGYGRSVSASELMPGDLIFYGSGSSISHVAIYIGNGQIVHASNSRDGIKVSNAFYRTPICCRRYL